jgi:Domain of unknown function (DUF4270)
MNLLKRIILFFCVAITVANCTKLDTTTVGQDLIPPIDGINTLASDTFSLTTENFIFNDSSRLFKGDDVYVGSLPSSVNFGTTKATLYTQFQPLTKFNWRAPKDSISQAANTNNGYDSAFVCLGLASTALDGGIYGDSMQNTTFNVYEIDNTNLTFKSDSAYKITTDPLINKTGLLGSLTIAPQDIKKLKKFKIKSFIDSSINQLRIKFNTGAGQAYAKRMLMNDSADGVINPLNAFNSPDKYKAAFKGFYIEAVNGKSVIRFTLANNANSRLEVWYNYRNNGVRDTTADFFYFNPNSGNPYISASANYIQRTIAGSAMQTASNPGLDNLIYLESTPGSYAKIKLPFIKNFPNKFIHKAELIITEQTQYDPLYFSPQRLYLDVFDTSVAPKYKTLPYDFYIPQGGSSADFGYFGGQRKLVGDGLGNTVTQYSFNVTKHIQSMISHNAPNYDMRLYVPYDTRYYVQSTFGYYPNDNLFGFNFPLINLPIFGRVVVGGGNKMKLRIVYSNI